MHDLAAVRDRGASRDLVVQVDGDLAVLAVILGTINVVGGFVVTDRMLEMFRRKPDEKTRERGQ